MGITDSNAGYTGLRVYLINPIVGLNGLRFLNNEWTPTVELFDNLSNVDNLANGVVFLNRLQAQYYTFALT